MSLIKFSLIFLLIFPSLGFTLNAQEGLDQGLMWRMVAETEAFLIEGGEKQVPPTRLYHMLLASWRSVNYLPDLGKGDKVEKVLQRFCYASNECSFRKDFVNYNLPGHTKNVSPGAQFTVDLGYVGLNAKWHVPSVYNEAVQLQKIGKLPTELKLKWLNPEWEKKAEQDYAYQKKKGIPPGKMVFNTPYHEVTQDDYDSMMVYRCLVEISRKKLIDKLGKTGWSHHKYDSKLYTRLVAVYYNYQKHGWYP